jgi:hypothetical protein
MQIQLVAGDHDWSLEGTHVLDDNGFALVLSEGKYLEVTQEVYDRIIPIVEGNRVFRGLNPDGSVPEALQEP